MKQGIILVIVKKKVRSDQMGTAILIGIIVFLIIYAIAIIPCIIGTKQGRAQALLMKKLEENKKESEGKSGKD